MISLKSLLLENREWSAWWMEPSGEVHEVYTKGSMDGHFEWAKQYVRLHFGGWNNKSEDPCSILGSNGWVRVTFNYYGNKSLHFDYWKNRPTDVQMRSLKKLAYQVGAERLKNDITDREFSLDESNIA